MLRRLFKIMCASLKAVEKYFLYIQTFQHFSELKIYLRRRKHIYGNKSRIKVCVHLTLLDPTSEWFYEVVSV